MGFIETFLEGREIEVGVHRLGRRRESLAVGPHGVGEQARRGHGNDRESRGQLIARTPCTTWSLKSQ